jgi:hypothetical protein
MVPDNPGAVDASIFINGARLCGVTLLPDPLQDGRLAVWGSPSHWTDRPDMALPFADAIEGAVRDAAGRGGVSHA